MKKVNPTNVFTERPSETYWEISQREESVDTRRENKVFAYVESLLDSAALGVHQVDEWSLMAENAKQMSAGRANIAFIYLDIIRKYFEAKEMANVRIYVKELKGKKKSSNQTISDFMREIQNCAEVSGRPPTFCLAANYVFMGESSYQQVDILLVEQYSPSAAGTPAAQALPTLPFVPPPPYYPSTTKVPKANWRHRSLLQYMVQSLTRHQIFLVHKPFIFNHVGKAERALNTSYISGDKNVDDLSSRMDHFRGRSTSHNLVNRHLEQKQHNQGRSRQLSISDADRRAVWQEAPISTISTITSSSSHPPYPSPRSALGRLAGRLLASSAPTTVAPSASVLIVSSVVLQTSSVPVVSSSLAAAYVGGQFKEALISSGLPSTASISQLQFQSQYTLNPPSGVQVAAPKPSLAQDTSATSSGSSYGSSNSSSNFGAVVIGVVRSMAAASVGVIAVIGVRRWRKSSSDNGRGSSTAENGTLGNVLERAARRHNWSEGRFALVNRLLRGSSTTRGVGLGGRLNSTPAADELEALGMDDEEVGWLVGWWLAEKVRVDLEAELASPRDGSSQQLMRTLFVRQVTGVHVAWQQGPWIDSLGRREGGESSIIDMIDSSSCTPDSSGGRGRAGQTDAATSCYSQEQTKHSHHNPRGSSASTGKTVDEMVFSSNDSGCVSGEVGTVVIQLPSRSILSMSLQNGLQKQQVQKDIDILQSSSSSVMTSVSGSSHLDDLQLRDLHVKGKDAARTLSAGSTPSSLRGGRRSSGDSSGKSSQQRRVRWSDLSQDVEEANAKGGLWTLRRTLQEMHGIGSKRQKSSAKVGAACRNKPTTHAQPAGVSIVKELLWDGQYGKSTRTTTTAFATKIGILNDAKTSTTDRMSELSTLNSCQSVNIEEDTAGCSKAVVVGESSHVTDCSTEAQNHGISSKAGPGDKRSVAINHGDKRSGSIASSTASSSLSFSGMWQMLFMLRTRRRLVKTSGAVNHVVPAAALTLEGLRHNSRSSLQGRSPLNLTLLSHETGLWALKRELTSQLHSREKVQVEPHGGLHGELHGGLHGGLHGELQEVIDDSNDSLQQYNDVVPIRDPPAFNSQMYPSLALKGCGICSPASLQLPSQMTSFEEVKHNDNPASKMINTANSPSEISEAVAVREQDDSSAAANQSVMLRISPAGSNVAKIQRDDDEGRAIAQHSLQRPPQLTLLDDMSGEQEKHSARSSAEDLKSLFASDPEAQQPLHVGISNASMNSPESDALSAVVHSHKTGLWSVLSAVMKYRGVGSPKQKGGNWLSPSQDLEPGCPPSASSSPQLRGGLKEPGQRLGNGEVLSHLCGPGNAATQHSASAQTSPRVPAMLHLPMLPARRRVTHSGVVSHVACDVVTATVAAAAACEGLSAGSNAALSNGTKAVGGWLKSPPTAWTSAPHLKPVLLSLTVI
ncbi:hypothetical protein CEUSTIGMA_g10507.t1 [Chlamydomonas eustigma]|uniref:Uncharacterized protein n=1 Tax=Chlamydomonas eustigma TaxID=1157962 RepID=A0A250XJ18_9CHLO|nr:hypothetical protein CEUSTIGMA_g10507.t1 [Chlamydomonas eustigma]|eukprot:GAX83081.1 hypothetical protein CEUSTIGMA_g10507.t1 [Chlamydomonas eustigma]